MSKILEVVALTSTLTRRCWLNIKKFHNLQSEVRMKTNLLKKHRATVQSEPLYLHNHLKTGIDVSLEREISCHQKCSERNQINMLSPLERQKLICVIYIRNAMSGHVTYMLSVACLVA